jgi:cell division protein FtsI/penicillin-binding protein 2
MIGVNQVKGQRARAFAGAEYVSAGKTGTAQVSSA